jgi:hypothetical protein
VGRYPTGEIEYQAPLNAQGLYDGEVKTFYKNGSLKAIRPYYKSRITGEVIRYYPNGKLESTEYFKNGETFGPVKQYYPTGQLKYEAKLYGKVYADTARSYYPNGELKLLIVYDDKGHKADFGAWHPNGEIDIGYTRPLFLSDRDSVLEGQDYTFEVVLGNRRSNVVNVKILHPLTGVDSTKGVYARTRFIIRRPAPGPHVVKAEVRNLWARKGSDTIWTNVYPIQHSFWVQTALKHRTQAAGLATQMKVVRSVK